jgi:hypothetical protein
MYQVIGPDLANDLGSPFWQHVSWKFSARSGLQIQSGKQVKEKELWRHGGAMVDLWA